MSITVTYKDFHAGTGTIGPFDNYDDMMDVVRTLATRADIKSVVIYNGEDEANSGNA